jgi:CheY-like chemotaxis protein
MKSKLFETSFFVGQPINVLLVDHFKKDAERVVQVLSKHGYKVTSRLAETPEEFSHALSKTSYDVVLSEFQLPGWTGLEALDLLSKLQQRTSFIVVTRYLKDTDAARIIDAGADDYILKNSLYRLPLSVRRVLRERRLFGELKKAADERERLIVKLEETLAEVKRLNGLLPVCVTCKRVLSANGLWDRIENYIEEYSDAQISPSLCPDCSLNLYPEYRN